MNKNYLRSNDAKFNKKMKSLLVEIKDLLDASETKALIFNTNKDYVVYDEDSNAENQASEFAIHTSNYYDYIMMNQKSTSLANDNTYITTLDDDKILFPIKYHTLGISFDIGFIIVSIGNTIMADAIKMINSKQVMLKQHVKEVRYLGELAFLKSENYGKLYAIIDIFHDVIGTNDKLTPIHMNNVAQWAMDIGDEFNLSETETVVLYFSNMIHDIGKVYIPNEIITKESKLTDDEYDIIKQHSEKGYLLAKSIIMGIPSLSEVPLLIKHHHEKYDGSGYPDGLTMDEIPFLSQIIAVCDSVDAMMSKRSYNSVKTNDEIIEELKRCSGTQFNPQIAQSMVKILENGDVLSKKQYIFDNQMFIPNVSVSFYHKEIENLVSFKGNFIINKKGGEIVIHDENIKLKKYSIKNVHNMKLMLFDRKKLYEFSVDIDTILDNSIYVEKLIQLPSDKYFSVYWEIDMAIDEIDDLLSYRVGADSVSLHLENTCENKGKILSLTSKVNSVVEISLKLSIDEIEELIRFKAAINAAYDFGSKMVYTLKYRNLNDTTRDKLFRYLFKRQIEHRCK